VSFCVHPFFQWPLKLQYVDLAETASLQRKQDLGHRVMQESVSLGGVKVQDAVECYGWETLLGENYQGLRHALLAEEPLAEHRENVLDTRA
jgi:hypothetical protein